MIFSLFDCLSPFLLIEFHCTFSVSYKIQTNFVYYHCILIRTVQAVGTSFFFRSRFFSFHTYASLLAFFVCFLSSFILALPMHECLGKHSCMSYKFPIVILNGTCFFSTVQLQVHYVYSERKTEQLSTSKPKPQTKLLFGNCHQKGHHLIPPTLEF